jgi:hypothetical protein
VTDAPRSSVTDLSGDIGWAGGDVTGMDGGALIRDPLVLVDLDRVDLDRGDRDSATRPEVVARAAARARKGGRLFVGITASPPRETFRPLLAALDVTLVAGPSGAAAAARECVTVEDPAAVARDLAAVAARFPQASLVLGQVLRASEGLPVGAALDVESFAYSMLLGGTEFRRWLDGRGDRARPTLAAEPVLARRDGDRLLVTLNRPERRNAYGRQLRDALTEALRVAALDRSVSRVVLDGAGPSFCSGGDLAEFGTAPDVVTAHFVRTLAGAAGLVSELRERIEVQVHGSCVGAGVELPAFAGTVTAAAGTTFRLPEVGMGLIPGAGGTVSIPRRIGRWRTFYLALAGQPLDLDTALAWGLVDSVR